MTTHQNNRKPVPVTDTAAICLQIDALTVLRGQRLVIDQLTHQQKHGELCILTGANGAGKSTLLRSIAGRLPAESGHIACHLPRIYIGHADGLAGAISGRKNLQSWAAVNDITVQGADIEQALAGFDATRFADMPVQLLSRGQRTKYQHRYRQWQHQNSDQCTTAAGAFCQCRTNNAKQGQPHATDQ